jgi:hypothetical protein
MLPPWAVIVGNAEVLHPRELTTTSLTNAPARGTRRGLDENITRAKTRTQFAEGGFQSVRKAMASAYERALSTQVARAPAAGGRPCPDAGRNTVATGMGGRAIPRRRLPALQGRKENAVTA